jgi:hypothetical protein
MPAGLDANAKGHRSLVFMPLGPASQDGHVPNLGEKRASPSRMAGPSLDASQAGDGNEDNR